MSDKITCTRRLSFCAGHRVYGHESKCSHLHGHNYVVEVTAEAAIDTVGRVIDFSVIKELLGGWIDKAWDHGFILWEHDNDAIEAVMKVSVANKDGVYDIQKTYAMDANPTAENIAKHLLRVICPYVFREHSIKVTQVTVHETENCYATVRCE